MPHRVRRLAGHVPYHVVLTVRRGVPALHHRAARDVFAKVKAETERRYPGLVFSATCLMPDHAHLVVQTDSRMGVLSRAMQFLSANLAKGLNRVFGRSGAVFRDRFFSRLLKTVSELIRALRYVGLNPVKAGLCPRVEDWAASSIAAFLRAPAAAAAHWSFPGWMYRLLGFTDPSTALRDILLGRKAPRRPTARQNRLPFTRGLASV